MPPQNSPPTLTTHPNSIVVPSPAKLNLFLHITGKRADGYHNLQTLFQIIDLSDTLIFTPRQDNKIYLTESLEGVSATDNLIIKAAHALRDLIDHKQAAEHAGFTGVDIKLQKILPMGGGLGGGSSNAATTLRILNQLWQLHLPLSALAKIGRTLGADVPIFVLGQSAWAEGIGEALTPLELSECHYLIATPPCHATTADIFQHPALRRDHPLLPSPDAADSAQEPLKPMQVVQQYGNSFEPVVRSLFAEIDLTLNWLKQFGPAQLTGTGSSCFVPFENLQAAELAYQASREYFDQRLINQQANPKSWHLFLAKGINSVKSASLG